jgi:hypothetical protein
MGGEMINLGRSPVQGGSVVLRVSFKDEAGNFYVPVGRSVLVTLVAQREEMGTWQVVSGWSSRSVEVGSVVDLSFQGGDLDLLSGCTTRRRVILDWSYVREGEVTSGRDMVEFDITPLPVLDSVPPGDVPVLGVPIAVVDIFTSMDFSGVQVGVLFSDVVDVSTVSDGDFYLGDEAGNVVSGVTVTWSGSNTLAWLSLQDIQFPSGLFCLYISGLIKSAGGTPLGSAESLNESGFVKKPIEINSSFELKRQFSDGSWEMLSSDRRMRYYWDSASEMLWFDGKVDDGLIEMVWGVVQGGGAHFQVSGGSRVGSRDIWAWDGPEKGEGAVRHYYTIGRADNSYGPGDEVQTIGQP